MSDFKQAVQDLLRDHQALITRPNAPQRRGNGTYQRWQHPILTAEHTPVFWRYDLNPETNPLLLERQGINSTFNAGALYWHGKYRSEEHTSELQSRGHLVCRLLL